MHITNELAAHRTLVIRTMLVVLATIAGIVLAYEHTVDQSAPADQIVNIIGH
jgi:hypothetical protein